MKLEMSHSEFQQWVLLVKTLNINGLTSVHNEIFSTNPPDGVKWSTTTDPDTGNKNVIVELDEELYHKLSKIIIPRASTIGKATTNIMSIPKLLASLKGMGAELKSVFKHS